MPYTFNPFTGTFDYFQPSSSGGALFNNGTGAATEVAFWSDATHLGGDPALFWDNTNKRLGIGTNAPQAPLHLIAQAGDVLWGESYDATASNGVTVVARRARGTIGVPSAVQANDRLFAFSARAYDGATFSGSQASLIGFAAETWAVGAHGTYWTIFTTPIGGTGNAERLRIADDGSVLIGTTTKVAGGKLVVNGNVDLVASGAALRLTGTSTGRTIIQDGSHASDITYTLPTANAVGVLTNNGAGVLSWGAGSGGGYTTIQEEGASLPARSILNFIGAAITAADDGSSKTNVTLSQSPGTGTSVVDVNRQVLTTAGDLTGGGDLSADRTLALATTAVTPATYGDATHVGQFTVDAKGRLTNAAAVAITYPGGLSGFGSPLTPSVNLTGAAGAATTALRSDAVLILDQAIAPTWTALHTHNLGTTPSDAIKLLIANPVSASTRDSHNLVVRGTAFDGITGHTSDWRYRVNVTATSGSSQLAWDNSFDGGSYANNMTLSTSGNLTLRNNIIAQGTSHVLGKAGFSPTLTVGQSVGTLGESATVRIRGADQPSGGLASLFLNLAGTDVAQFATDAASANIFLDYSGALVVRSGIAGTTRLTLSAAGLLTVTNKITGLSQATGTTDAVAGGRTITAGSGLTGGGDLTVDRTISLTTPITATIANLTQVTTRSHSDLQNLVAPADDHTQYSLLAGRAGGQILRGGTATGDSLTLAPHSGTVGPTDTGRLQQNGQTRLFQDLASLTLTNEVDLFGFENTGITLGLGGLIVGLHMGPTLSTTGGGGGFHNFTGLELEPVLAISSPNAHVHGLIFAGTITASGSADGTDDLRACVTFPTIQSATAAIPPTTHYGVWCQPVIRNSNAGGSGVNIGTLPASYCVWDNPQIGDGAIVPGAANAFTLTTWATVAAGGGFSASALNPVTLTNRYGLWVKEWGASVGGTLTNHIAIQLDALADRGVGTTTAGIVSAIAASVRSYFLRGDGTAVSFLQGGLRIGDATATQPTDKLEIVGNAVVFTGNSLKLNNAGNTDATALAFGVVTGGTLNADSLTLRGANVAFAAGRGGIKLDDQLQLWSTNLPTAGAGANLRRIAQWAGSITTTGNLQLQGIALTPTINFNVGAGTSYYIGLNEQGTFTFNVSAATFPASIFNFSDTFNLAANLGAFAPVIIDDATVINASATQSGSNSYDTAKSEPQFNVTAAITATLTDFDAFHALGSMSAVVSGTAHIVTRRGLHVGEFAKSGTGTNTLDTQVGLDVETLANATVNIGVRNRSTTVNTPSAAQSFGVNGTITVNATVLLVNPTAAGLTLTLSTTNAQDGQVAVVVNTNATNGFTLAALVPANKAVSAKGSAVVVFSSTLTSWVAVANV